MSVVPRDPLRYRDRLPPLTGAESGIRTLLARAGLLGALAWAACTATLPAQYDARAQRVEPDDARIERLEGLARVWGQAKYFHPRLAGEGLDWDAALVEAIPEVEAATSSEEYGRAVQRMLARLDDPLTRVLTTDAAPPAPGAPGAFGMRFTADDILVITAGDYYALGSPHVASALRTLGDSIARARAVVFDVRASGPTDAFGRMQLASSFAGAQRLLAADTLPVPGERRRVYYGMETPSVFSSGQYRTGFFTRGARPILPVPESRRIPSIFVLNRYAGPLPAMHALQAAGSGRVVCDGDLSEHTVGSAIVVDLTDGLSARVRNALPVLPSGTNAAFRPDTVVAPSGGGGARRDAALEAALALARGTPTRPLEPRTVPATAPPLRERSYADARYPDRAHRLLAAFRFWNAIEFFYPYKHRLDRDWDAVLPELIRLVTDAGDEREYALAVADMATRIQDSHAYLAGALADEHVVGPGYPPIRVRSIQDSLVVTAIHDPAAADAGIAVGDVVLAVDGVPAADRLAETARYLSASTPQSRLDRAALTFMNGPVASMVALRVRDGSGRTRDVRLERRREDYTTLYHRERTGDVIGLLAGNVGYVDLDRLTYGMVDSMFTRLADTRAIIFDMRGYPQGTIWSIAPRLARETVPVALFTTPMPGHGSPEPAAESFFQTLEPAPLAARYGGETLLLMDERTVSQAEHTGLYLRAANGTRFIGSPTAGADGEITSIVLPGAITVGFTGQEVRHPDGRHLQRVGLQPDVPARPTIQGIRDGRDEVLEAAIRALDAPPR